ncbi:MAG TPA: hypothetical protein VKU44_09790 [Terriglobia bacterium]|nr:hypothetical protein [Terriglobia bacterium]
MKRVTSKRNRIESSQARRRRTRRVRLASHSANGASRKAHGDRRPAHKSGRAHARPDGTAKHQRVDPHYLAAIKAFELAVRQFQRKSFAKARQIFAKLCASAYPEVADRAKLHMRLCEQRKAQPTPTLKSAQDYYVLGVAELNARQLDSAVDHLKKADRLEPNREHIHYALAAAQALQGNADVAIGHLRLAVALRPQNSFQARGDDDFRSLASDPRFKSLVGFHAPAGSNGSLSARSAS